MLRLPDSWVWDFWIAQDPATGTYHAFFLFASKALHHPDRRHLRAAVGHATSTDLVRWERVPDALLRGDAPDFDQTATWTGSVIQGPDGRWFMFYTGTTDRAGTLVQRIGVATSADLLTWTKHDGNPVLDADPRWYETHGGPSPWQDQHWRDPWVFADPAGDGWHLLITARAADGPIDDRGVIGHAWSADLTNWHAGPPLSEPGSGFGQLEVPSVEVVDGCAVLIFNCLHGELSSSRKASTSRSVGIWAAPAAGLLGPFNISGATPLTDDSLYVGKLVRDPAGRWVLLAFENAGPEGSFGGMLTDPMPVRWDGDRLVVGVAGSRESTG